MTEVERALEIGAGLGEGPVWSADEGVLYWLDIFAPSINRFDPRDGSNKAVSLAQPIYAMALRQGGGMVGAFEDGLGYVDFESGEIEIVSDPKADQPVNFNDGGCDRKGRLWSGTMAKDWTSPLGKLFRFEASGTAAAMDHAFILANGLGWSPDDAIMYFTDTGRRVIYAYDFELESGTLANRRDFIQIPEGAGVPDGLTVDAAGYRWIAIWDGWKVTRYDPTGRIERVVEMPVQRPTSCMFGGDDLSVLYITSATMMLSDDELAQQPMAGDLFAYRSDVKGLPEHKFAG